MQGCWFDSNRGYQTKIGDTMKILRDGEAYEVVGETHEEYAVLVSFDFANFPYKRKLKLWWDKKYCTPLRGRRECIT